MNSARIGTALVPTCGLVVSMPSMTKRFSEPDEPSIEMPPACDSFAAPAACATTSVKSRPRGTADSFTRDVGRGRRAGEIDADGGGGNLNRLRDARHRQRELDARRRADRQVDRALPGGEPAQARVDLVDARRQPREAELALLVRYRVDDPRRAGGLDGHAGKHCATGVVDDPDDRTGRFLGSRRSCQHEQPDEALPKYPSAFRTSS